MRKIISALILLASVVTASAQAPPPVPGLPDTERRTSYSINSNTCACNVNFALYGDSTDYQNWVEVWLNGVRLNYNDPTYGWTITTPTGSLATRARPISDAILTFNNVQTGTVQIVGARRPRRVQQFSENQGVAARDLNQALTDIVAQNRETWDKTNDVTGRALLSQPGNTVGLLPLPAACSASYLGFDGSGLIPQCYPIASAGGGTVVGASPSVVGQLATWTNTLGTALGSTPFSSACVNFTSGAAGCVPPSGGGTSNFLRADGSFAPPGGGLGSNNTWTGNNYFSNGRPWCDVRGQGAVGDGVTDDTAAIMACVNYLNTNYGSTGGVVYFPSSQGSYCTFTGINDGTSLAAPITFSGAGMQVLQTCGHNVTTITITHQQSMVENFFIYGYGFGSDTFGIVSAPAIVATTGASYAIFRHLYVAFGTFPLQVSCSGCRFEDVTAQYGYGDHTGLRAANAYVFNSGQYWNHVSLDQVLPIANGPVFPTTIAARANSTSYTAGTVVTTGGHYIQYFYAVSAASVNTAGSGGINGACVLTISGGVGVPGTLNATVTAGGLSSINSVATIGAYSTFPGATGIAVTGCGLSGAKVNLTAYSSQSGVGAPTLQNYGNTIIDGTARAYLVAPQNLVAMQADTGVGELMVNNTDMTGFFASAFSMTNSFGGVAPTGVYFHNVTPGGSVASGISLEAGSAFHMDGGDIQGCLAPGCAGIFFKNSFSGTASIQGTHIWNGMSYSALVGTGVGSLTFTGNHFTGSTTAVAFSGSNTYIAGIANNCSAAAGGISGVLGAHSYFPLDTAGNPGC